MCSDVIAMCLLELLRVHLMEAYAHTHKQDTTKGKEKKKKQKRKKKKVAASTLCSVTMEDGTRHSFLLRPADVCDPQALLMASSSCASSCASSWKDGVEGGCPCPCSGIRTQEAEPDRYGRAHVLRWLLWEAAMPALQRAHNGALALHYAAARGCLDCVRLLLEAEPSSSPPVSANTQMDNDVTPVYLAAQEGHLEVLQYLVTQAGGSLYVRAKDGMAPVHAASQMGCLACLKWMVLEQGVDPNLRDGDGATPLHFAASRGHVDTVRWLLRHGAAITLDKYGKSAINDAAENQQMECLSLLVQHGTSPDYVETRKNSPKSEASVRCPHAEPFYLHPPPPPPPSPPPQDGLYINPMSGGGGVTGGDPFYLHQPGERVYSRVEELFAPAGVTVKVEVHSSSSGAASASASASDENLSSSDLSERSGDADADPEPGHEPGTEPGTLPQAEPEPEYEDIYLLREDTVHVQAHVQVHEQEQASMSVSTESGVSSASPSDLAPSEEEPDKIALAHRHSLPHAAQPSSHARALKRVVSEPTGMGAPPPPPPPPKDEEGNEDQPGMTQSSEDAVPPASPTAPATAPLQAPPSPVVNQEPVVRPSEVLRAQAAGRKQQTSSSCADAPDDACGSSLKPGHGPNLVNKQMVLPFVPPRFPSNVADSNSLIKPSEYLRSLGGVKTPSPVFNGAKTEAADDETLACDTGILTKTSAAAAAAAAAPPPPPLPSNAGAATLPAVTSQSTSTEAERTRQQQQQPLGAISIHDLNSVQLRRTDKMMAAKTLSAPPRASTMPHPGDAPFQAQKEDLIAELKLSRDIPGIKKLKVERAKVEERQEKEMFSEITRSLTANSFVEKIPDKDATGNPIPEWKRQMLAKKAAERARKELELQMQREAEEKRLQAIPAWKRQLLAKKEEHDTRKAGVYTPRVVVDDKRPSKGVLVKDECWHVQQQAGGAPEVATSASVEDCNKENKTPTRKGEGDAEDRDKDEEKAQIMPWRAQLRKTNSKLSLVE